MKFANGRIFEAEAADDRLRGMGLSRLIADGDGSKRGQRREDF